MLRRLFLDHPQEVGESYGEHLKVASHFGFTLVGAGLACIIHGLVPGLFKRTGSDTIRRLHARLSSCPHRAAAYEARGRVIAAE
jgi:hypothetical protein